MSLFRRYSYNLNRNVSQLELKGSEEVQTNIADIINDEDVDDASKSAVTEINAAMEELGIINTTVSINFNELKNTANSDVAVLKGINQEDDSSIINESELALKNTTTSKVLVTTASKIIVKATSITNNEVSFEIIKMQGSRTIKLTLVIKKSITILEGSLVVKIVDTHKIFNFGLDINQIPDEKIKTLNYSLNAIRVWSENTFTATALSLEYLNESDDVKEFNLINLPIEFQTDYYELLIYDEEFRDILQASTEYIITINQDGETKTFNLRFNLNTNKQVLGYNFTDTILSVSFTSSLILNNTLQFLLNKFSNLTNVTEYFRDYDVIVKSYDDVDIFEDTIKYYLYTENENLIINNQNYLLEELFDKFIYVFFRNDVFVITGLAYGGSGILKMEKKTNVNYLSKYDIFIDNDETLFDSDFIENVFNNEYSIDKLEAFYDTKNVIKYENTTLSKTITIDKLEDLETYELIASSGTKFSKLVIKYENGEDIILDFSNLSGNNLGNNFIVTKQFIISFNLRFIGSGSIGDIIISPIEIPCFTNTCYILTPTGYKNITEIKIGDIVTTIDKRNITIKRKFVSKTKKNLEKPYLIKAHSYGNNKPFIDTYISAKHRYKINNIWTTPEEENLTQKWKFDILKYYHLQTDDYENDILVVNGLPMETWNGKLPTDIKPKNNKNKIKLLLLKN